MNKYLQKYIDIKNQLAQEFKQSGYTMFEKITIANELDYEISNYENTTINNLTDEQQEFLIDIILDFSWKWDSQNFGICNIIFAFIKTINIFREFKYFEEQYRQDNTTIIDNILWNL